MRGRNANLGVMPRRSVLDYLQHEDAGDGGAPPPDEIRELKQRIERLERGQSAGVQPVAVPNPIKEQAPSPAEPEEGRLRRLMRRMAD